MKPFKVNDLKLDWKFGPFRKIIGSATDCFKKNFPKHDTNLIALNKEES